MSHEIRRNPLTGSWTIVSGKRVDRPWRSGECPFCPGREETMGEWKVLSLPNRFPALSPNAPWIDEGGRLFMKNQAIGECEVIVESPQHEGDFPDFSIEQVSLYVKLLSERTRILESKPYVKCVIPFKNKGSIIGVSLTHPHSQIYALPFIPPRIMKEIESAQRYRDGYDRNLFEDILRDELEEGTRIIYGNKSFLLFLPFFVMWPYEVHVYPKRNIKSLTELGQEDALMLADIIRVAVAMYEEMFGEDCAYMMIFHQSPIGRYDDYRLHIEFYTPCISKDRIKYAAGIEWGAWIFTYDGVPEERVKELKQATRKIMENLDHLGEAFT